MKIDPSKKYKTRDGRKVSNLMRADANNSIKYPWVGFDGLRWLTWNDAGEYCPSGEEEPEDLVEDREPREWKACVRKGDGELYKYDPGDEGDGYYEVVRVREIIEL